jgi:hypothetical protein
LLQNSRDTFEYFGTHRERWNVKSHLVLEPYGCAIPYHQFLWNLGKPNDLLHIFVLYLKHWGWSNWAKHLRLTF